MAVPRLVPVSRRRRFAISVEFRTACIFLILWPLMALAGCAFATPEVQSIATEPTAKPLRAVVVCPSEDFATFLKRFADPEDDTTRRQFTADPLLYEVPTHTLRDDTEGLPPMQVDKIHGEARLEKFQFRYIEKFNSYVPVDLIGSADTLDGLAANTYSAPVSIERGGAAEVRVSFGAEYEIDVYTFTRTPSCWQLTQATDPRD